MRRSFGLGVMLAGMALGACTPDEPAPADSCDTAALASFVCQPAEALTSRVADRPMRVIGPDTMVTMEFVEGRLNIYTDAEGIILRIACG